MADRASIKAVERCCRGTAPWKTWGCFVATDIAMSFLYHALPAAGHFDRFRQGKAKKEQRNPLSAPQAQETGRNKFLNRDIIRLFGLDVNLNFDKKWQKNSSSFWKLTAI
jgi:hypothetical protein